MSHLSKIKTLMTDISYLKKSLEKLKINHFLTLDESSEDRIDKIVIPQKGSNIEFVWTGKSYEMSTDLSFWQQSLPANAFLDLVNQTYLSSCILENGLELGFQHLRTEENTILMERWV